MIDANVRAALDSAIIEYAAHSEVAAEPVLGKLASVLETKDGFMEKVALLDRVFDDHGAFEELREFAFDLLLTNFFAEDVQKLEEDYLESAEWEAIEEATLDRGTELLNILMYLRECEDAEVEPSLTDFLKEYLLVDEDEFQDEHAIYERVIENQILVETSFGEIVKVAESLDEEDELKDLFYPLLSFFNETLPTEEVIQEYLVASKNKALDAALYQLILHFYKP